MAGMTFLRKSLPMVVSLSLIWAALAAVPAFAGEAPSADAGQPTGDPFQMVASRVAEIAEVDEADLFKRHFEWVAVENLDFESANEDGSLSVWQPGWYIAHDWSDYGMAIADLEPGDAVTVNGDTILILGKKQWLQDAYTNWDIYDVIGWDKYVFQTCLGDEALWIVYGVLVHPTPEFLAQHS